MTDESDFSLPFNFESSVHQMDVSRMDINSRRPIRGQYDFKINCSSYDSKSDFKLYSDDSGRRVLFVSRDRPFVIKAHFHCPLTPVNLYLRLIPYYTQRARKDHVVCRCANHATTNPDEPPESAKSFITVQSRGVQYPNLANHLTVLVPVDRLQLALEDDQRRSQQNSNSFSQQQCSYPTAVLTESLACRIRCYTSCLGGHTRGATELIVRLEELNADPNLPPIIHGVDRIEIHCSATPARDIKTFTDKKNGSVAATVFTENDGLSAPPSVSNAKPQSSASHRRHRGVSEPSGGGHSKRLHLVNDNNNLNCSAVMPVLSASSQGGADDTTIGPNFIDLHVNGSSKKRYYVLVTTSEEMALHTRGFDDARVAFHGMSFSKTKFLQNRAECQQLEKRLVASFLADTENRDVGLPS